LLNDNSAPVDGMRSALLTPYGEAAVVGSALGYFNAQTQVAAQYEDGMMGRFAGFTAKMSQNLPTFTGGALGGTPRVNGAAQGISTGYAETGTLVTNGWTASISGIMNAGDVFTIPGVYAVNVQNRTALARLQQFVVLTTANSDAGGNATLSIAPAIISGGPFQNVSVAPANTAVVTPLSGAGVVSPQFLAYHKSAFAFVSRPLEMPGGLDFAAVETDKDTGISIRVVRQYAIGTDTFPMRMDILYGWRELYPEFAVRLAN
jgi:hypothetical protein